MKRRTRKKLPQLAAAGTALSIDLAGLGYITIQSMGKITPDEFGCYESIEARTTAVMLDVSEPRWDKTMQRGLHTAFERLYDDLQPNERLTVYTTELSKLASIADPAFYVCGQFSSPDELPETVEQAQAGYLKQQKQHLYDTVFKSALDKVLALDIPEDQRQVYESPIFEMIQTLNLSEDLSAQDRLWIVSDGIQSTESARFCTVKGAMPAFKTFKTRRIYQERLALPDLTDVEVQFLFLQRGDYGGKTLPYCNSEEEIRRFWQDAFKDSGADVEYVRIRSGAEQ